MHVNSRPPISRALNASEGGSCWSYFIEWNGCLRRRHIHSDLSRTMAFKLSRAQEMAMETSLSMASFDSESNTDKLVRKSKDAPFLILGITGCTLACAYGAYMFKKRNIPMSLYLIQLRVAAQGTVVGCLACGLAYTLARDYIFNKPTLSEAKK